MPQITLVAIGEATQATALRAVLETMNYETRLLHVRSPAGVAPALVRASRDDVVILSARAGQRGLLMGASVDEDDPDGMFKRSASSGKGSALMDGAFLPMSAAFDGVTFRDNAVLFSTASATRESGLAEAVFKAGGHLIAPAGYPQAHIIVPWIAACLLTSEGGLAEAVAAANALVAPENRFSYG